MTEDDLKRLQDNLFERSKKSLMKHGHIGPVGFVITHVRNIDKLLQSGYGVEFIDPKATFVCSEADDTIATLTIDLAMDWKKLYHAVLTVFPKTQNILPGLLALGAEIKLDDPYKRLMRPFLSATELDTRDIIAATMRQICDKTEAFASIFHSEAWQRAIEPGESPDKIPKDLGADGKSIEVLIELDGDLRIRANDYRASPARNLDEETRQREGSGLRGINRDDRSSREQRRAGGAHDPFPEAARDRPMRPISAINGAEVMMDRTTTIKNYFQAGKSICPFAKACALQLATVSTTPPAQIAATSSNASPPSPPSGVTLSYSSPLQTRISQPRQPGRERSF